MERALFIDATVLADISKNTQDLTTFLIGVFAGLLILAFLIGFLVAKAIGTKAERKQKKEERELEKQAKKEAKSKKKSKNKKEKTDIAEALDTNEDSGISAMPIIPSRTSSISFDDTSSTPAVPVVPVKSKRRVTNDVEKSQSDLKARAAAAAEERKIEEVKKANELHEAERGAIIAARAAAKQEEVETDVPVEPQLSKSELKKQKKAEEKAKKEAEKQAALKAKEDAKAAALKAKEDAKQAKLEAKKAKKNKNKSEEIPEVEPVVVPEEDATPMTADEMAKRLESLIGPSEPISFGDTQVEEVVEEGAVEAPVQPGLESTNDSDSLPAFESENDTLPSVDDYLPSADDVMPVEDSNELPAADESTYLDLPVQPATEEGDEDNWVLEEARRMAAEKPIEEKKPELPFAFGSSVESSADDVELSNKQKKKIKEKEEAAEKAKADKEAKEKKRSSFSLFGGKKQEEEVVVEEEEFDESYMGEEIPDSLAGFGFSAAPVLKPEDDNESK